MAAARTAINVQPAFELTETAALVEDDEVLYPGMSPSCWTS